ncbi:heme exporter protein CcmB [Candidatus Nitrosacidococcus tergens]|uniref:Heme exporter protein B n=1 Tax=Candidatus Nitrosacidococcus tergens TaxID=553981 RepID=A0A7G1QB76_9GAMM|nr:heme exporter protein CcmB [Candidatus Nitrosacidococcus tergens]CAB1276513.1 heme exporter subunit; membrane component of ABC superfamily [Candidatus Nitrosacidococcus tergens]
MNESTLFEACWWLVKRDLLLVFRHRSDAANPLLFFLMIASVFPLGIGPEAAVLKQIAPGIIWVSALLATLLSLESIFRSDFNDGSLEQLILSPHPLSFLILAKIFAHWLVTGLPLILLAPLLGLLFGISGWPLVILLITLLISTPALSLVGAVGVALTVGLRQGGLLLTLLLLPLYVPILIFSAGAVETAARGLPTDGQIYLLSALLVLAISLAPMATSSALCIRIG